MDVKVFEKLEERIKSIIDAYEVMKRRNQELEGLLNNKILELEEANRSIRGLKEERDLIRTKVDSLLNMLQDIQVPK